MSSINKQKIILIGGEKGGTGKTTIASNLAVLRKKEGRDILGIDTDPQGSFSLWSSLREDSSVKESSIPVIQKFGNNIAKTIADLSKKYDDIIIDAGGRDSVELRSAMVAADIMVVPFQASQFDVWTLGSMEDLVKQAKGLNPELKVKILINRAPTNPSIKEVSEFKEVFDEEELEHLKPCKNMIKERVAYRKAAKSGKSVIELDIEDKKASNEIKELYNEVINE